MNTSPLGLLNVKVVALGVTEPERARRFYGETLGLEPAYEGEVEVGFYLGSTLLMLKSDGSLQPTDTPNPRITFETVDALLTEQELRAHEVIVSDCVMPYDEYLVGSFLDSEGNKLWFCSETTEA